MKLFMIGLLILVGSPSFADVEAQPDVQIVCGYYDNAFADPDYRNWLDKQILSTDIRPPMHTIPTEHYYFIEKTNDDNNELIFKTYELRALGSSTLLTRLRSSIVGLMEIGKPYCIAAEIPNATNNIIIHSIQKNGW